MDSQQQQFCLKWNSFGSNLATSFSNLFKSESLADVTLFCDGVTFKAHKLILAACSKHLADLFETAPLHQNLLVILDGTSASNMSALLEFMYKGEVHVSQDSLSSFLKAAECLQVKGLSIEHEKLAVAQSVTAMDTSLETPRKHLKVLKEDLDNNGSNSHHQSSPSPSYSPTVSSPYMHPHHYRYDQRMPTTDLRMKMEPGVQQDEPPSSTGGNGNGGGNVLNSTSAANGSIGPQTNYNHDRDKDLIPASLWSTVAGKLSHKTGTVNTPDGKKLKCPFCERLYGYETNLRAHIRQRHQGIRVPCPFCSRTFTRNNTVRRHIAREHKAELSLKAFQQNQQQQQQQQQVLNHNP